MKKVLIPLIVMLSGVPTHAAVNAPAKMVSLQPVRPIQRNFSLEGEVFARSARIDAALQPQIKSKIELIARKLLDQFSRAKDEPDAYAIVQSEVHLVFPQLTPRQSELMSFHALAETARMITDRGNARQRPESMNELSDSTSLRLQMMMDQRSKFMSTLSNILKKISSTDESILQNMK